MFHGKSLAVTKVQLVIETQTVIANVNVVDVDVSTKSKVTEEQVFKDRKPRKANSFIVYENEKQLKKLMVETIQQIQKTQTQIEGPSTSMEGWNITQPGMPNTTIVENIEIIGNNEFTREIDHSRRNFSQILLSRCQKLGTIA